MERLTLKLSDGTAYTGAVIDADIAEVNYPTYIGKAVEKLAAYEDIGYTPEELKLCFDPPEVLYEIGNEIDGERVHPIYPVDGEQIEFAKGDVYWNCRDSFGDCVEIPLGGLHKEYFLDREEAEAKLKEMEGSHAENRSI